MNCPSCGAPVQVCKTEDGTPIPLETYDDLGPGPGRYVVTTFGNPADGIPHTVAPVSPTVQVRAYADHRQECSDFEDGRAGRLRI